MFKRILTAALALLLFTAVLLAAVSCGADNTPTIGENGNWFIGDKDTGVPATGKNGVTANVCSNAYSAGTSVKE